MCQFCSFTCWRQERGRWGPGHMTSTTPADVKCRFVAMISKIFVQLAQALVGWMLGDGIMLWKLRGSDNRGHLVSGPEHFQTGFGLFHGSNGLYLVKFISISLVWIHTGHVMCTSWTHVDPSFVPYTPKITWNWPSRQCYHG
jgi:hypothetical protein